MQHTQNNCTEDKNVELFSTEMTEEDSGTQSKKPKPADRKLTFRLYAAPNDTRLLVSEQALPTLKNAPECAKLLDPTKNYELDLPTRLQTAGLAAGVEQHCTAADLEGFSLDLGKTLLVCTNEESAAALAELATLQKPATTE